MKKFLFTLAALLMAGSMYADCYFQPQDFEIPQDKIGKNVQVPVQAVFNEYVSAWECTVTIPDGLTFVGVKKGETFPITGTYDEFGDEQTISPDISRQETKFIVACMAGAYSEDGDYWGVAKWAPNTYDEFLYLVVKADETFAGGEITMSTTFSCGADTREEVNNNKVDNTATYVSPEAAEITVEGPAVTVDAPIYWTSLTDDYLYIFVEVEDEEATLTVLDAEGQPVTDLPIAVARPDYDPTADDLHAIYTAYATKDGVNSENVNIDEIVPQKPEVIPTNPTDKPELVIDGLTITATGEGTVIIYIDDVEVARGEGEATYTVDPADYPDGAELPVVATAQAEGLDVSEPAVDEMIVLATLKGAINIGEVDQETGKIEISYNGNEEVTLTVNGEKVRMTENTYQLEDYGTWDVTVTAAAEGYYDKTKTEQRTWNAPAPQGQTAAPEVITTPGDDAYTITGQVKEGDPEAEVSIYLWDEETQDWVPVANPFIVNRTDEDQTIKVKVVAHIDGQEDGETIMDILVPAKPEEPETGVNELMNGKTVAGVRYFNLAGQEMQEANGVTIVVTTYTDGTTSAVKVMK